MSATRFQDERLLPTQTGSRSRRLEPPNTVCASRRLTRLREFRRPPTDPTMVTLHDAGAWQPNLVGRGNRGSAPPGELDIGGNTPMLLHLLHLIRQVSALLSHFSLFSSRTKDQYVAEQFE